MTSAAKKLLTLKKSTRGTLSFANLEFMTCNCIFLFCDLGYGSFECVLPILHKLPLLSLLFNYKGRSTFVISQAGLQRNPEDGLDVPYGLFLLIYDKGLVLLSFALPF